MATVIKATGDLHPGAAPSLAISSGRGNTDEHEILLTLRDEDGENSRAVTGWFRKDDLLAAIENEDRRVRRLVEVGEPA